MTLKFILGLRLTRLKKDSEITQSLLRTNTMATKHNCQSTFGSSIARNARMT